jgi:hypothetical protein
MLRRRQRKSNAGESLLTLDECHIHSLPFPGRCPEFARRNIAPAHGSGSVYAVGECTGCIRITANRMSLDPVLRVTSTAFWMYCRQTVS